MSTKEIIEKWNEDWDNGIRKHLIIDDVLERYDFTHIQKTIVGEGIGIGGQNQHWKYIDNVVGNRNESNEYLKEVKTPDLFMMACIIFVHSYVILPRQWEATGKIWELLQPRSVIRVKCNLYPATFKIREHENHTDYDFSHKAAIFYLNTCDGYTKLEDGTKVDSVENRLLLFDAGNPHCSSTCTNKKARFNINFNYF